MSLLSYPEARYHGSGGEVSATYRPAGQAPNLTYPASGVTIDYLATGASSDGDFGLYRWTAGPEESGPAPHFHRTISESFFILSGTMRIYNGTEWLETTAGDYVYVPPGGLHGFRSVTGVPASMLLLFTPGAPREGYFEGLINVANMTDEEKTAFYEHHDNHWV
jgi:mannose-6-phosphate isomerase-like protein (cupin superfamily)